MKQTKLESLRKQLPNYNKVTEHFMNVQAEAAEQWRNLPLPKIERMRYDHWDLFNEEIVAVAEGTDLALADLKAQLTLSADEEVSARIIHYGNQTFVDFVSDDLIAQGVIIDDLFTAMEKYGELVDRHLFSALAADEDKMTAYHTAYLNGGLFIYIPKDVEINLPIEAVFVQDSSVRQAFNKHVLIVTDKHSRLSYLERSFTIGSQANSGTLITEVVALDGSQVKFVAMDSLGESTTAFVRRHGLTFNDATIEWVIAAMNHGDTIFDSFTELRGRGSSSNVDIISIANGTQVQTVNTKLLNVGHNTTANIFQHGVILDQGRLSFNGIGHIIKNAKGADNQQESRLMMLSNESRGDTNPILYIDEFEVTAGHAASVGQVDPEQLYYLMSRGLSKADAQYLLIRGFLGQVIQTIPSSKVRQQMVEMIDYKLKDYQPTEPSLN